MDTNLPNAIDGGCEPTLVVARVPHGLEVYLSTGAERIAVARIVVNGTFEAALSIGVGVTTIERSSLKRLDGQSLEPNQPINEVSIIPTDGPIHTFSWDRVYSSKLRSK